MESKIASCADDIHRIDILNFSSGEQICYSVVVIEGVIESDYDCKAPMEITAEHIDGPSCDPPITFHKISSNMRFKCILKLKLGMNKFILKFCSVCKEIILHYKPRQTKFCVTPVYVICKGHDGRFQAPECEDNSILSACERISTGVHLIQSLFAESLRQAGYGRRTFQLQTDIEPTAADCHILYSNISVEEAHSAEAESLWTRLAREIMLSNWGCKERKYVAFLSSTHFNGNHGISGNLTHEEVLKYTKGYVSLGGGGLALVGTGCLHTWATSIEEVVPRLSSDVAVDTNLLMDQSNYRRTYGGCYSTTLGAVAHEMGHTFDLGHTSHGIMGSEYHNIQCMLLPEEPALAHVKSPSKLNFVQETLCTSIQQDKSLSFEEEEVELEPSTNKATREEQLDALVRELRVVCSMPNSQLTRTNTDLSRNKYGQHKTLDCLIPILDINDTSPFWPTSCLSILALHKWFNPNPLIVRQTAGLNFDIVKRRITSECGLGVIEIRDAKSMAILHWNFSRQSGPREFTIPKRYIFPDAYSLWVIDPVGNSKKFVLKSETQT